MVCGSGADPRVAKIATAFVLGRDVGPLGVLIAAPFRLVTHEEERLVLAIVNFRDDDRAAQGHAKLVATHTRGGPLIESPPREPPVSGEPEFGFLQLLTAPP